MNTQDPQALLEQVQLIHTAEAVQSAIGRLGKEVTLQLEHTCPIVICVMGGGIVFAGRLGLAALGRVPAHCGWATYYLVSRFSRAQMGHPALSDTRRFNEQRFGWRAGLWRRLA